MTKALDAAIRAAESACLLPPDGGAPTEEERAMCVEAGRRALRAALPAEPPAEVMAELVDEDCPWSENLVRYTWSALRAHLLGEDA